MGNKVQQNSHSKCMRAKCALGHQIIGGRGLKTFQKINNLWVGISREIPKIDFVNISKSCLNVCFQTL